MLGGGRRGGRGALLGRGGGGGRCWGGRGGGSGFVSEARRDFGVAIFFLLLEREGV